ncbi:-30S ribosomal protein S5 [Babesia bigemina]|uniref:-30S ribosomal protein S5 n=1 Tax=Babesia bigemina TaxID=5866 RepID=A0A061DDS1_BABBI|nr:-30S ribosomal protein S5 [Babesia bigemina]CDR97644.1 -30S ribosomal protein S5 [Babesia bigemina]|eukprot:XP_012769830.1 -30S ribosomal protein S5 [Babesia bigemina]
MLYVSSFLLAARGHVQRVLRRKQAPFHQRYDRLPGDQRERVAAMLSDVRYEKCSVARELSDVHQQLASLFNADEARQLLDPSSSSGNATADAAPDTRADINEAYRIHRILRPHAPNFFEEQSFIHLKQRMDNLMQDHKSEDFKELVPADVALDVVALPDPLFSDEGYAVAMSALMDSLIDDVRRLCRALGLDVGTGDSRDPYDRLADFLALKRDGSNVDHWSANVWPKLKPLMAAEFESISEEDVGNWLTSHLERVAHNRALVNRAESSEWYRVKLIVRYDIKRDLPYDGLPYPDALLDERRTGYPIDRAGAYLFGMLQLFAPSSVEGVTKAMLDEYVDALRNIGLKDWFGLRGVDISSVFFGHDAANELPGNTSGSGTQGSFPHKKVTRPMAESCIRIINLFATGNEHVFDAEHWSPASVFKRLSVPGDTADGSGSSPAGNVATPSSGVDSNSSVQTKSVATALSTGDIEDLVGDYIRRVNRVASGQVVREYNRVFDRMVKEELEFQANVGAGTVTDKGIEYKVPAGAQFDAKRNYYVRTREGVDPTLKLENLRSCVLERRRMRTMTKEGRVYFLRVVVAVGDGRGYFGTGVGFGNDLGTARASAVQQALRGMYFIDFDQKEPLTTPVLGQEYGCRVYITPRKMGAGIKTNRKYLPLAYLAGLDNCKLTFHGRSSWITRAKALRKALEQIYSRRTMCNATGMRYVYVGSPGDHTVHWPDKWFIPIAKEYQSKVQQLKNLKRVHFRRHAHRVVMPEEVAPEVPSYARHKFRSPLEIAEQERKHAQYISTTVPKVPPPRGNKGLESSVEQSR